MVVSTTKLTSLLIMVILSLYNFVRSYTPNIKKSKRRCAHGYPALQKNIRTLRRHDAHEGIGTGENILQEYPTAY